jgi:hypothetical protein
MPKKLVDKTSVKRKRARPKKNESAESSESNGVGIREVNNPDDPNQTYLGDMGPDAIPEIETQFQACIDSRAVRAEAKESDDINRDELAGLMQKHGINRYRFQGKEAILKEGGLVVQIKKSKG